jgi:hypothetical protein
MPVERSIVVVQSFLLWASFVATAALVWRRRSAAAGITLLLFLLCFLRFRDAASVVLSEAVAMAIFLPAAAILLLWPPSPRLAAVLGLASGILFGIRPNVGAALLLLAVLSCVVVRRPRALLFLAGAFLLVVLPVFLLTRSDAVPPGRGLDWPVLYASAEDYWEPSLRLDTRADAEALGARLRRTGRNWAQMLGSPGLDRTRQVLWRALHGLFGVEFADERWSPSYGAADRAVRTASPLLVLAGVALVLGFALTRGELLSRAFAAALLTGLVAHNLVFGSLPRYLLPFLPVVFLVAVLAALSRRPRSFWIAAAACFLGLFALLRGLPGIASREWGQVEASDVILRQQVPRGSLPRRAPATLHVRIASPRPESAVAVDVRIDGVGLTNLADSYSPSLVLPLPQEILTRNQTEAFELVLTSRGAFGPHDYLLFPVVSFPFGRGSARREASPLSPSTGIGTGALDWWAHDGPEELGQSTR